jgi:hypothetical protein
MRFLVGLLIAISAIAVHAESHPDYKPSFRIEQLPIAGGAELLTVIGQVPGRTPGETAEVPMLSVLRDTLGDQDPGNDRLRYVWVLSSTRPSMLTRAAGALPFFYFRPHLGGNPDQKPVPMIDLGATSHSVWTSLAGQFAQVLALDPNGALIRSSTRTYRNNLADHRRVHLLEGLALLSQLEDLPEIRTLLSEPELLEMQTRLTLAGKPLGGLVAAEKLPEAYVKQRTHSEELRGHNWELLRQRAEANGLYFQPFEVNGSATHALLWVATADLTERKSAERKWDGRWLGIADPFTDDRLHKWAGYREVRNGREMIPLGLYALEYPKVPLLLVDFRATHAPKRREMIRHAATDTVTGVLGISQWGNWPYMAGAWAFNFVRERHGAANNRTARLQAYSEVREWLALDGSLDSGLRADLQKRLEVLGVNPMEESVFVEAGISERQYAALVRYAQDPHGLPERLEHDRRAELSAYENTAAERARSRFATLATLGIHSAATIDSAQVIAGLDEHRQLNRQTSFLATVARSSPQTDVVWNMDEVRRALDQLAGSRMPARSAAVIQQIMRQTTDEETRALCQRALQSLNAAGLE